MEPDERDDEPDIRGRTDTGGAWAAAGPLLALALIGLMLVQSCLPNRGALPTASASLSR